MPLGLPLLCESQVAGQKCCCHTHPLTPLVCSSSPEDQQSLSHHSSPLANSASLCSALPGLLRVPCRAPQASAPWRPAPWALASTGGHTTDTCTAGSWIAGACAAACCPGAVGQSCPGSSCVGCKHSHVHFNRTSNNQRQQKFSLAFPFPGTCFLR